MKWQVSPKHLKVVESGLNFQTENPIYIREQNCIGLELESCIRNFISIFTENPGCMGLVWSPPDGGHVKYITMWPF